MRLRRSSVWSFSRSTRPTRSRSALEQRRRRPRFGSRPRMFSAVEPVVERAVEDELDERLQVELLRRHAEDDRGAARGVSRTVLVWQTAQLSPT